jgi:hypothetical protein
LFLGIDDMKDLQAVLKLVIVALVAGVALGFVATGRAAVREHYEYEAMVAPRTLHQMVLEMEAADETDRTETWLYGAGLLALSGLVFGGMMFAMRGGTDLLKERRLGRKKQRRQRRDATAPPHAPHVPLLPDAFPQSENYANDNRR